MKIKDVIVPYGEQIRTGTADSILSGLYRSILYDIGIVDEGRFLNLVHKYVARTALPSEFKEISSIRGNLRKELMKPVMTWKVFIKGLLVLNVIKVDVAVSLNFGNNKESETTNIVELTLNDKEITTSDKTLSSLFRKAMKSLNVSNKIFTNLINNYIIRAKIPNNVKEVSSTKGNLKKELLKDSMSWKVYIKGLLFLNVTGFVIGVNLHHRNGKVTKHYRIVNLDSSVEDLDD